MSECVKFQNKVKSYRRGVQVGKPTHTCRARVPLQAPWVPRERSFAEKKVDFENAELLTSVLYREKNEEVIIIHSSRIVDFPIANTTRRNTEELANIQNTLDPQQCLHPTHRLSSIVLFIKKGRKWKN